MRSPSPMSRCSWIVFAIWRARSRRMRSGALGSRRFVYPSGRMERGLSPFSISLCKMHPALRGAVTTHARTGFHLPVEGDHAHSRLRVLVDHGLARGLTAPVREQEPAGVLDLLLELVVRVHLDR